MKCYLINLDRAPGRLAYMNDQFRELGLSYERVAARDGNSLSASDRGLVPGRLRFRNWSAGELGCLLSHYQAWLRIGRGEEAYGAVFEDDVALDGRLRSLLSSIEAIYPAVDLVKLETNTRQAEWDRIPSASFEVASLHRLRSLHSGAGAYVLARRSAQQLAESISLFDTPVDDVLFGRHRASRGLKVFQAVPAVAEQISVAFVPDPMSPFASDLEPDRSKIALESLEQRAQVSLGARAGFDGLYRVVRRCALAVRQVVLTPARTFGSVPATNALRERLTTIATSDVSS